MIMNSVCTGRMEFSPKILVSKILNRLHRIKKHWQKKYGYWGIAIRKGNIGDILIDRDRPFTALKNGLSWWVADPFVFEYDSHVYLFAEFFSYWRLRGEIAVTEIVNGKIKRWKSIIREPFHMSYPFVFSHNDEIYMIPETNKAGVVRLYRCVSFPYKWEFLRNIADNEKWVDTTLFSHSKLLYGFTRAHNDPDEDFFLEFDNRLNLTQCNRIKKPDNEDTSYRCGGYLFKIENYYVHPCQNETKGYGSGLVFRYLDDCSLNEVDSARIYPESIVIDQAEEYIGIHTYSSASGYEVIDYKGTCISYIRTFMEDIRTN